MTEQAKRISARLGKGVLLIILLNVIFSTVRGFGHQVLEVGIIYQGSLLVQYEFGEECILDAIASLAALVSLLFILVVRKRCAERTGREARKRNGSAFPVAGYFILLAAPDCMVDPALSDKNSAGIASYRKRHF